MLWKVKHGKYKCKSENLILKVVAQLVKSEKSKRVQAKIEFEKAARPASRLQLTTQNSESQSMK